MASWVNMAEGIFVIMADGLFVNITDGLLVDMSDGLFVVPPSAYDFSYDRGGYRVIFDPRVIIPIAQTITFLWFESFLRWIWNIYSRVFVFTHPIISNRQLKTLPRKVLKIYSGRWSAFVSLR